MAVYVDDLVIMCDDEDELIRVKQALAVRFHMRDLGALSYCLGISVLRNGDVLKLHHKAYVDQMLRRYGIGDCNPVATPAAIDVKLMKSDGSKPVDHVNYQSMIQ